MPNEIHSQYSDLDKIVLGQRILKKEDVIWFSEPKLCSEVRCQVCGFHYGHVVPMDKTWICGKCENFDTPEYLKSNSFLPKIDSISIFNVQGDFVNATIENCWKESRKPILKKQSQNLKSFIIFQGKFQKGKTYSACALLEEYRKNDGINGYFKNFEELFFDWKSLMSEGKAENALLEFYYRVEFLVIDDFGVKKPTEAFLDFAYSIINKRCSDSNLGTLITTNLTNNELKDIYGARILSRLAKGNVIKFE